MDTLLRRSRRGLILLAGVVAAGAVSFAAPQFAHAQSSFPEYTGCRPDEPKCNPYNPPPTVYQAVGRDADEDKAQQEAEQQAAQFCGARGYKHFKVLLSEEGNQHVYTLLYYCG